MNKNAVAFRRGAVYTLLFILFYIITYTDFIPLKIGNAAPQLLISAVVAVGFFYGEWVGFTVGMITGIFADAVAANTVCFNMIAFMLIGFAVGISVNSLINRNILSAFMLSVMSSFLYFFFYWLVFFVFKSTDFSIQYFIYRLLPSLIYSSLFIFPAYLPGRYLK